MKKATSIIAMAAITGYIIFQLFLAAPSVETAKDTASKMSKRNSYLEESLNY